jgi:hypothetical protein
MGWNEQCPRLGGRGEQPVPVVRAATASSQKQLFASGSVICTGLCTMSPTNNAADRPGKTRGARYTCLHHPKVITPRGTRWSGQA